MVITFLRRKLYRPPEWGWWDASLTKPPVNEPVPICWDNGAITGAKWDGARWLFGEEGELAPQDAAITGWWKRKAK